jgi:hypothetical protein
MSLGDLASLGSFSSGVAVMISLVYLALQVRQAEKNQRAFMEQGRADRLADLQMRLAEPQLAAVYVKALKGDDLTETELAQFRFAVRALMAAIEDGFLQHKNRMLSDEGFGTVSLDTRRSMSMPGRRAMWRLQRGQFNTDFRDMMDRLVAETPLARADNTVAEWRAAVAAEFAAG